MRVFNKRYSEKILQKQHLVRENMDIIQGRCAIAIKTCGGANAKKPSRRTASVICLSAYNKILDLVKKLAAVVAVDLKLEILGEVETEDTHNGLCVNSVSAADDVHIIVASGNDGYEVLNIVDRVYADFCSCHNNYFLSSPGSYP